jgi:hypothetical protein
MNTPSFGRALALLAVLALVGPIMLAHGQTWLQGSVYLEMDDGIIERGEFLRIYLVTGEIDVASLGELDPEPTLAQIECINDAHMKVYHDFLERKTGPGYLVADTETSQAGEFLFTDLLPGDYLVLILFPAMINGYKVIWQVPVRVAPKGINHIVLHRKNMALPAMKRRAPILWPK